MATRVSRWAAVTLAAVTLAACSTTPAGEPTTASSTTASPPASDRVSIALSWTPNTDYTGVYVAQHEGIYAANGIDLTILPYAETAPETLVASGAADFGFSYQAGVAYARATGQKVVSVFAPTQKGTYAIGVSAERADITRPRDLDGKVYAGFGTPDELPLLRTVIRNDGGRGDFTTVTLNTSAYEAVAAGSADFTIPVATWEGVQARRAGKPMRLFSLTDYGIPDQYSVLIISSESYLAQHSDVATRFLAATQRGYAIAATKPVEAARAMVAEAPAAFPDPQLVEQSQQALVDGGYLATSPAEVGRQDLARWQAYGHFLYSNQLLSGPDGSPLPTEPDWSAAFTNRFLP